MRKFLRPSFATIGLLVVLLMLAGAASFMQVSKSVYASATGSDMWSLTGSMSTPRSFFTLTQFHNGMVLAAGGEDSSGNPLSTAELYNPATGKWTSTGSMTIARFNHTATLLSNGKVLVAGGSCSYTSCTALASAELYNPATGKWTLTGSMHVARENHTATLLANGKVLVAGGDDGNTPFDMAIASAELYDPSIGTWTLTGSMHVARFHHSAVKLADGSVLVVGGDDGKGYCCAASPSSASGANPFSPCFCPHGTASTEIYNPTTGTWRTTGKMNKPRTLFTAISIPDGTYRVLVAGGIQCSALSGSCTTYNSAEIYDPSTGKWTLTGNLHTARDSYGASQLNPGSGQVIVAGGRGSSGTLTSTETFTVSTGTWSLTGSMNNARANQLDVRQHNGDILTVGGGVATAEIYTP